jgi:hypothetical protein
MNGKGLGIFLGSLCLAVGLLLLAFAYVSSVLYGGTGNSILYSPWLDWGLVILGAVIIAGVFVASLKDR